jgi:hypothetical protein
MLAKSKGALIYGFMDSLPWLTKKYPFVPMKGRGIIHVFKNKNAWVLNYNLPELKLEIPKKNLPSKVDEFAIINWPIQIEQLKSLKLPDTLYKSLSQLIDMPINSIYGHVLDTISTNEKYTTYDIDDEFMLTQKINYIYKTFPGLWLCFNKSKADHSKFREIPTSLGFDIFKFTFQEQKSHYIIMSENKPIYNLPKYYLYLNFALLKTDPFWKTFIQAPMKEVELILEEKDKGAEYIINILL